MDGARRPKDDLSFETLGTVDEAQVALGVCRGVLGQNVTRGGGAVVGVLPRKGILGGVTGKAAAVAASPATIPVKVAQRLDSDLQRIQFELLTAGGILSCVPGMEVPPSIPLLGDSHIDMLSETFQYWRGQVHIEPRFFIAGDSRLGSEFDRARTVIRRAERLVVRLVRERGIHEQKDVARYLNQLSDLCFVLARWADAQLAPPR